MREKIAKRIVEVPEKRVDDLPRNRLLESLTICYHDRRLRKGARARRIVLPWAMVKGNGNGFVIYGLDRVYLPDGTPNGWEFRRFFKNNLKLIEISELKYFERY